MDGDIALAVIYLVYGLAFYSMGLAIVLEIGRGSDAHLRHALRPLAAFGLIHGLHEWIEMLHVMGHLPADPLLMMVWDALRLGLLAFSFLSLAAFGAALLSQRESWRRLSLLVPLAQSAVWGLGVLVLRQDYPTGATMLAVGETWTRYVLGISSALLASAGLVMQQRAFRQAGMVRFGQDSLWAAIGFAWYGVVGQMFVASSPLPPSDLINAALFFRTVGIPIQLARAAAGLLASVFVMRFLRAFEVEMERQIAELRAARLEEATRREALRGELLLRVVSAQEAERKRVARELHDDTGQALTAIGLGLRAVSKLGDSELAKARRNLRKLEAVVDRAMEDLQRMIADLRPSHLDDLGLPAALRWYANELGTRGMLQVEVNVSGETRPLEPPVTTGLFRVAQEALTNVVKHAEESCAQVRLVYGPEQVQLEIEDCGRGFDPATPLVDEGAGWGLLGMAERAHLFGGTFDVDSSVGRGTRVRVTIPYEQREVQVDGDSVAVGG
jgi:signal transduction histidine kinase